MCKDLLLSEAALIPVYPVHKPCKVVTGSIGSLSPLEQRRPLLDLFVWSG